MWTCAQERLAGDGRLLQPEPGGPARLVVRPQAVSAAPVPQHQPTHRSPQGITCSASFSGFGCMLYVFGK